MENQFAIEWKINIGHLISIIAILASMFILWGETSQKLDQHTKELQELHILINDTRNQVIDVRIEQERLKTVIDLKENKK